MAEKCDCIALFKTIVEGLSGSEMEGFLNEGEVMFVLDNFRHCPGCGVTLTEEQRRSVLEYTRFD